MQDEIQALEKNHTWTLTDLQPSKHPIGCRWVPYKIMYEAYGNVERYKACLVALSQGISLDKDSVFPLFGW